MRATIFVAGLLVASGYLTELAKWRTAYEEKLKAPGGWLSVSGLFWLHEGENVVGSDPKADIVLREGTPRRAGMLRMNAGAVTYEAVDAAPRTLKSDSPGPPDVVTIGTIAMTVIK